MYNAGKFSSIFLLNKGLVMNKNLTQLIAIAKIDTEAGALDPIMQEKQAALDKLLAQKVKLEARLRAIDELQEESRLTITRNETIIQDNSQKIEEIQKRLIEPRSDREARTLSIEEDLAKENIKHSNNEIARLNKEIETREAQIRDINAEIDSLQNSIKDTKEICEKEISQIKAQKQEIFKKKEVYTAAIDAKVITFYEKIRRWAKNTSVVPVKKQACGGCFIRLNDKLYSDIIQSGEIISCPHCGRILYITDESGIAKESKESKKTKSKEEQA